MKKIFLTVAVIYCLLSQAALPAAAQTVDVRYVVEDLSANSDLFSSGRAINSVGQVAGIGGDGFGGYVLLRSLNGTMQIVGLLGSGDSNGIGPTDINDFGLMTGSFRTASGKIHAFLHNNVSFIDLGGGSAEEFPGGDGVTRGRGINNLGEVVGYQGDSNLKAFYYDGTTMRNLNRLIPAGSGWNLTFANDINDKRQIVGGGFNATISNGQIAYRYTFGAGSVMNIGPVSSATGASSINNSGRTVGFSLNEPSSRAFVHGDDFGILQLGAPAPCGGNTGANDINARGTIVGEYYPITNQTGCPQAFSRIPVLWMAHGVAIEVNRLIDPASGWTITEVKSINDRGQIAGTGTRLVNGVPRTRAVRLTPIRPENNQVADFDGDGRTDISVFRPSAGDWHILRSATEDWTPAHFGAAGDKIAPGDFDGDGRTDLTIYRNNQWLILESGTGSFRAVPFGLADDVPLPADYDADGKTDIAVFRPSNGYWYISRSSDNAFAAQQFGLAGDKPVVGDYDGDGRADQAVYRPSNGYWYVLQSTLGFNGVQFGASGDKPVAGDYDGDGRTDFAIYRPSDGVWYLLRSTAGFTATQFGIASDEPAPGDYDGDGKFDLGVYRGGTWYLQQSRNGFRAQTFGIAGDVPVPAAYISNGN